MPRDARIGRRRVSRPQRFHASAMGREEGREGRREGGDVAGWVVGPWGPRAWGRWADPSMSWAEVLEGGKKAFPGKACEACEARVDCSSTLAPSDRPLPVPPEATGGKGSGRLRAALCMCPLKRRRTLSSPGVARLGGSREGGEMVGREEGVPDVGEGRDAGDAEGRGGGFAGCMAFACVPCVVLPHLCRAK
jgi:hypothetical protein